MKNKTSGIYVALILAVVLALTALFNFLPRSRYSELERRELKLVPEFSLKSLRDGLFTDELSAWYSDSEPFRDDFMYLSMLFKDAIGIKSSKENISIQFNPEQFGAEQSDSDLSGGCNEPEDDDMLSFADSSYGSSADSSSLSYSDSSVYARGKSSEKSAGESLGKSGWEGDKPLPDVAVESLSNAKVEAYEDNMDAVTKMANSGIIIVGSGSDVRALMGFFGTKGGVSYANICNKYKETFGPDVNVYCMPIPTSTEYYCPPSAQKYTKKQWPVFNNIFSHLSSEVKVVDVYSELARHTDEGIYLRTDHHWAPLGGYYAAKVLCQVAGVPFRDLSSYEEHVIKDYVGSMYGFSHDVSVKRAPENFVYHIPLSVEYTTTYINYSVDSKYRVTAEGKPFTGPFFHKYPDGSGAAYCTFMGGDMKIVKVVTSTKNNRKIIILKDSFGNAVPGYLFYSFEEIHVIDFRYFTKNLVNYVVDNGITDIVFANNIGNACGDYAPKRYSRFLTQSSTAYTAEAVRAAAAAAAARVDSAVSSMGDSTVAAMGDSVASVMADSSAAAMRVDSAVSAMSDSTAATRVDSAVSSKGNSTAAMRADSAVRAGLDSSKAFSGPDSLKAGSESLRFKDTSRISLTSRKTTSITPNTY